MQKLLLAITCYVALLSPTLAQSRAEEPPRLVKPTSPKPDAARVVTVHDAFATEAFRADLDRVRYLVARGIMAWTGHTNERSAWLSLVSTNEVIGIKVHSSPGPNSGTRLAVAAGIVQGLLRAGMPATNIIVWDKHQIDLRLAGFYDLVSTFGIRVESALQAGYDPKVSYEHPLIGTLVWGDLEFGTKKDDSGRRSHVTKLVTTKVDKLISIAPMLNHNQAGVAGNFFSLTMGSVDNASRFEGPGERMNVAVPEIYNLPAIADKVVLCIVDALICQYEGGERGLLHYSVAMNELRFSNDPVALDVLSIQELARLRERNAAPRLRQPFELYRNASLLDLGTSDSSKIKVEKIE